MRDPHVTRLLYAMTSDEGTSYQDPPPVEVVDALGTFVLADAKLTVTPAEHYANEAAARAAIEPYLRAWEIAADLNGHVGELQFQFETADLVDRHPPDGAAHLTLLAVGVGMMGIAGVSASLHVTRRAYPPPPTDFQLTRDVAAAYRRWMAYRDGRETLLAMANFVLTVVERVGGSRQDASKAFAIDYLVLSRLGKLTGTRGDEDAARKAPKRGQPYADLSPAEKGWLEAAIPLIIRRLGTHAAGATLPPLTLHDLPALPRVDNGRVSPFPRPYA